MLQFANTAVPTGAFRLISGMVGLIDCVRSQIRSLHDMTGLVAQDTQLFGNNVEENIAYGYDLRPVKSSMQYPSLLGPIWTEFGQF